MAEREDPLNPDEERKLFEKLSMDADDLRDLEYIRFVMKSIIKKEYAQTRTNQETPRDDAGTCQTERGS